MLSLITQVAWTANLGLYPQFHSIGVYVDCTNAEKAAIDTVSFCRCLCR